MISPDNRSFRYGDGFFETLKIMNGKILLVEAHMERLFASLGVLKFDAPGYFNPQYICDHILGLVKKNGHEKLARIRITLFRGNGGLYELENHSPNLLIQSWELNPANNKLNENGLDLGFYRDARKVCDGFSALKHNNFLSYSMAALWAKENKLNDAILLNPYDKVADATIANVFIVKDGIIKTPPLSDGPVNGVMRRYLLKCLRKDAMPVEETSLEPDDLLQASELFLTNAIYGIRWVKQLDKSGFTNAVSAMLHNKYVLPLIA